MTPSSAGVAPRAPLGLYLGDDAHELEAAALELARKVAGPNGAPLERVRVSGSARRTTEAQERVSRIAELVGTPTLFGGGALVVVGDAGTLLRYPEARDALLASLALVTPGNALALLVDVENPEWAISRKRLPQAIEILRRTVRAAGGEERVCAAPRGVGEMAAWIERQARSIGLSLRPGAARTLAQRVGGAVTETDIDRRLQGTLAAAELEKLALLRPAGDVSVEDVEALVPEAIPGSFFAFLEAVGERRAGEATQLADRLMETAPQPLITARVHRLLRELIITQGLVAAGEALPAIGRQLGTTSEWRVKRLVGQARRWTPGDLVAALEGLLALDAAAKGDGARSERQQRLALVLWITERVRPSPS